MIFTVLMITLTVSAQSNTIHQIKVHTMLEFDKNHKITETPVNGRMGIDFDNKMLYSYYRNGTTSIYKFTVDRKYNCEDGYINLEGIARNIANGSILFINIASHRYENLIIITMTDNKTALSFVGSIY